MVLMNARSQLGQVNTQYAANVERIYGYARDNDLRAMEAITDAKGDRDRCPLDQDDPDLYTQIIDQNADGIRVRGAKLHITSACLAHEIVVMPTKAMGPGKEQFSLSFSIPAETEGIKVINQTYAQPEMISFDYPLSAAHSMPEGFIVFDDVFVPSERVFLAGEHPSGRYADPLELCRRARVEHDHRRAGVLDLGQLRAVDLRDGPLDEQALTGVFAGDAPAIDRWEANTAPGVESAGEPARLAEAFALACAGGILAVGIVGSDGDRGEATHRDEGGEPPIELWAWVGGAAEDLIGDEVVPGTSIKNRVGEQLSTSS